MPEPSCEISESSCSSTHTSVAALQVGRLRQELEAAQARAQREIAEAQAATLQAQQDAAKALADAQAAQLALQAAQQETQAAQLALQAAQAQAQAADVAMRQEARGHTTLQNSVLNCSKSLKDASVFAIGS